MLCTAFEGAGVCMVEVFIAGLSYALLSNDISLKLISNEYAYQLQV
jgi:hypothetical protein